MKRGGARNEAPVAAKKDRGDSKPSGEEVATGSQDTRDYPNGSDCFEFLASKGHQDVADVLKDNEVTSNLLDRVTEVQLKELGISPLGKRLKVIQLIQEYTRRLHTYKIVNDPIHGHIEIHPLCVKIIDTPQFQRLRFLKQLGGTYFVYPGAAHNRFEHSLGVCYLAGKLASALGNQQPELEISNTDILCVQIAGLCHDLGHGPFSHMFDGKFLPAARPGEKIKHEILSQKMFDYLVESNNLIPEFEKYGLMEQDRKFIKEQIKKPELKSGAWPYEGRSKEKSFLYEIVSNNTNGIDVDKWDYFARDCHMLGIKNNFDHARYMKYARVLKVKDKLQICSRDKEVLNLYEMFHTRNTLHRRAYQHIVGNVIETMITEALLKADGVIRFAGKECPKTKERKMLKISETVDDMEAYQKLTDDIFQQILWSSDPNLEESRKILMNIQRRELYRCLGETHPPLKKSIKKEEEEQIKNKIKDELMKILKENKSDIKKEDIILDVVYFDYGKKDQNPIDHVGFYKKRNPTEPIEVRKSEVSDFLPEKFAEQLLRFYCKRRDEQSFDEATVAFKTWRKQNQCSVGENSLMPDMTPIKSDDPSHTAAGSMTPTPSQTVANQKTRKSSDKAKVDLEPRFNLG